MDGGACCGSGAMPGALCTERGILKGQYHRLCGHVRNCGSARDAPRDPNQVPDLGLSDLSCSQRPTFALRNRQGRAEGFPSQPKPVAPSPVTPQCAATGGPCPVLSVANQHTLTHSETWQGFSSHLSVIHHLPPFPPKLPKTES